jgi:hypothetical protein
MLDLTVLIAKCLPPLPRPAVTTSADGPGQPGAPAPASQTSDSRS